MSLRRCLTWSFPVIGAAPIPWNDYVRPRVS
jgi:hypothetical protein